MNQNIFRHKGKVSTHEREILFRHKSACIWFTGLSGSGKSTLAFLLEKMLIENGIFAYVLDGDNIRTGLNEDLDFSINGRKENIRRIGETAALFVDAGMIVITSFISPFKEDRLTVRNKIGDEKFIEVFVDVDLETCESRDPKGLYKKAREKKLEYFTGVTSPYEKPEKPELVIHNGINSNPEENVKTIFSFLVNRGVVNIEQK